FKALYTPKAVGVENLQKVLANRTVDFVWVTSSLASVLGGIGYSAYAASNLYVDHMLTADPAKFENWKSMQLGPMVLNGDAVAQEEAAEMFVNRKGLCQLFENSLHMDNATVIAVVKDDLNQKIADLSAGIESANDEETQDEEADSMSFERPDLSTEYVGPKTDTEQVIVNIVEELFGIRSIGMDDNFYEIGGDSLKAVVLLRRIKKEFGLSLSLEDILGAGTFGKIGVLIDELKIVTMSEDRESTMVI
ncbi:MAG: KR domain-containing protein, partial [Flavobacteriales bacterium]|nr:KR domain-containing protein [Flavobacteriales bacterium]